MPMGTHAFYIFFSSMTVPDVRRRWNMSAWAIKLNELTPALAAKLPVTDARRRRDVRLFEEGFSEKACAPCNGPLVKLGTANLRHHLRIANVPRHVEGPKNA